MEISLKPQSFDLRRDIKSHRNGDIVVEVGSTVTSLSLASVGNLGETKKAEDKIAVVW